MTLREPFAMLAMVGAALLPGALAFPSGANDFGMIRWSSSLRGWPWGF